MKIIRQERIRVKRFVIPLLILLLAALQNSFFEFIRVYGIKPDLAITFVICYTLIKGNPEGTIAGIIAGVLEDVFSGIPFGINSIGCMIIAYLIGSIEQKLYKDNVFVPGLFTFGGTVLKEMIALLFLYLTRAQRSFAADFFNIILPEALYNTVITIIFYRLIVKLSGKFYITKSGGFNS